MCMSLYACVDEEKSTTHETQEVSAPSAPHSPFSAYATDLRVQEDRAVHLSNLRKIFEKSAAVSVVSSGTKRSYKDGDSILSEVQLDEHLSLKGKIPRTYVAFGGTIGDTSMRATDVPVIQDGEVALAFFLNIRGNWILKEACPMPDGKTFTYFGHEFSVEDVTGKQVGTL